VLELTLHADSYEWQFIPVAGRDVRRQWHDANSRILTRAATGP
jgi:hypothetical protein